MSTYHLLTCIFAALFFAIVCVMIFFKVKNVSVALIFYVANAFFSCILAYSGLLWIEEKTKQAVLSDVRYARNLRTESVTINGRVTNTTKFAINKCFLELTITDKVGADQSVFDPKARKSVSHQENSVNYVVQVASALDGHTYKDFSVQLPFPPRFKHAEFYHILKCI